MKSQSVIYKVMYSQQLHLHDYDGIFIVLWKVLREINRLISNVAGAELGKVCSGCAPPPPLRRSAVF